MTDIFDAWAAPFDAVREEKSAAILENLPDFLMNLPSGTGLLVNFRTALQSATVLACSRVLAEGVSQVPWKVMRARPGGVGADPATDHPLYRLLNRRPNSWQTSFEFRETMMLHLVLSNNFYAWKNRVRGQIHELIPIQPEMVSVTRNNDLSLTYQFTREDGQYVTLPQEDVWHVRGPSWNSWIGLDAVKLAREAIGLSMALEQSHARMHKNGAQPGGIYSVDKVLTPEQHTKLRGWIKETVSQSGSFNPLILDNAAKWTKMEMSGVDSQHLETRRYQVEEICRAMRVLPIMVGMADKTATYASAEQMFLAHVIHSLTPWCERIEQSADVNLLGVDDDTGVYCHLDLKGLMRGAIKDRGEYLAKALGAGGTMPWMSQDEARDFEDMNPMGGDASKLPPRLGTPAPPADPAPADA